MHYCNSCFEKEIRPLFEEKFGRLSIPSLGGVANGTWIKAENH